MVVKRDNFSPIIIFKLDLNTPIKGDY